MTASLHAKLIELSTELAESKKKKSNLVQEICSLKEKRENLMVKLESVVDDDDRADELRHQIEEI